MIIELEILVGILEDSDGSIATIKNSYLSYCQSEYYTLIENYSSSMIENLQTYGDQTGNTTRDYNIYENENLFV